MKNLLFCHYLSLFYNVMFSVLAQSITPVLQSSFREVFTTAVIPGFERATQNLYANLATTFTKV